MQSTSNFIQKKYSYKVLNWSGPHTNCSCLCLRCLSVQNLLGRYAVKRVMTFVPYCVGDGGFRILTFNVNSQNKGDNFSRLNSQLDGTAPNALLVFELLSCRVTKRLDFKPRSQLRLSGAYFSLSSYLNLQQPCSGQTTLRPGNSFSRVNDGFVFPVNS